MKPHLLLVALVYLLLSGTSQTTAQPADKTQRREDVKALRTDMRAWFERSVQPTLLEWKRDYDASLSAEDLAALNVLRQEAKAHMRAHWKNKKHDGVSKDVRHDKKDGRHHEARKAFLERLKPIAERSKGKLRSIFENGKDRIEVWRSEALDIFDNWQESHPDARQHFDPHMGSLGVMPFGPGHGHMGKRAAIRFILWDGTVGADEARVGITPTSPIRVAPLPAAGTVALALDDMQNGPATIELFTMDGNLVKSLSVNIAGNALDETIDVSALPTGTYMASVNTPSGRRTSQIVVNR